MRQASTSRPASASASRSTAAADAARLARAKGYPYTRPESSFVFFNGQAYTFDDSTWQNIQSLHSVQLTADAFSGRNHEGFLMSCNPAPVSKSGYLKDEDSVKQLLEQSSVDAASLLAQDQTWTPVLAIGSNAGPSQLARKFPAKLFPHGVLIPALRAVLPDFDVVYAPLVSSYGSATATLEYSPGTKVAVYVTFLTPDLLERMDATEGAYFLCELFNINLRLGISLQDFGLGKQAPESLKFIFQYNHQHGTPHFPILLDGQAAATSPIAIQEIPAADRRFPTLSQTQMQRALKYLFQNRKGNTFPALPVAHDAHHSECQEGWKEASEDDLDTWILENLDDSVKRGAIVDALTAIARPFGWESSKIMRTLGDRYAANVA
ncbi:hypothetical protein WJX74_007926 [Apatococcus lobatus]|uniref:Uncharacterized protein n=1 Tax=Apatococcus lobatus TaxID=904363 RepID=A0AAW1SGA0_9CHLO